MSNKIKHTLLDAIMADFNLKNDAQLSKFLDIDPPHTSRLRRGKFGVSGDIILRVYDKTGWGIEKIRSYLETPE